LKWAAVIVAAGSGTRLGRPKQLIEIAGLPMAGWSIRTFASMPEISEIVVATEREFIESMHELLARLAPAKVADVVRGGATRQQSVHEGLKAVRQSDFVLVHDGARPLVSERDVRAGMGQAGPQRASLLAAPVIDTIKSVDSQTLRVTGTLDRGSLWAAQTPQFASTIVLLAAHERAVREGIEATDDAMLLERFGTEVVVVPASGENFKVTLPEDLQRAQAILRRRARDVVPCHPDPSTRRFAPRSGLRSLPELGAEEFGDVEG
jgi:2-C-methyl-D-erythritol 4-phosphate cytidylyltransferase